MEQRDVILYIQENFEKSSKPIILEKEQREQILHHIGGEHYNEILTTLSKQLMDTILTENKGIGFGKEACRRILEIYDELLLEIEEGEKELERIREEHVKRIQKWIQDINRDTYHKKNKNSSVTYSPEFQLEILGVALSDITGPVLELGCGKQAKLVSYLRTHQKEAYGLDKNCDKEDYLIQQDWLEHNYEEKKYQMILSVNTFTRHFLQQHTREEGEFKEYAIVYMKLLHALQIGGTWCYTPSLTFMEELLPEEKFEVRNEFIDDTTMRTKITRIA